MVEGYTSTEQTIETLNHKYAGKMYLTVYGFKTYNAFGGPDRWIGDDSSFTVSSASNTILQETGERLMQIYIDGLPGVAFATENQLNINCMAFD